MYDLEEMFWAVQTDNPTYNKTTLGPVVEKICPCDFYEVNESYMFLFEIHEFRINFFRIKEREKELKNKKHILNKENTLNSW